MLWSTLLTWVAAVGWRRQQLWLELLAQEARHMDSGTALGSGAGVRAVLEASTKLKLWITLVHRAYCLSQALQSEVML